MRKLIWNPRCEKVQECKKSSLEKGKGKKTTTFKYKATSAQNSQKEKEILHQDLSSSRAVATHPEITTGQSYTPGLTRVLWNKIKEGRKWLGI